MSRYINANMYIEYLTELKQSAEKHHKIHEALQLQHRIDYIKCFPTVDVQEVRHGEWMPDDYEYNRCSECGYEHDTPEYVTPYCPGCGAKME